MVPILETEYAQLTLDQELSVLKLIWKEECVSETYRFVYENILDLCKKTTVRFYIADIRKLGLISQSDRKWLQTKVIPKLFKSGMEKIGTIVDGDVYTQRHLSHINQGVKGSENIKQFGRLEEAIRWFKDE
ncbi:MAG: hypothetical protein JXR51_04725 [Bacteroidales bacterium]|nr:hypothetical protein [Bacteroidales bacterium]MBN2756462.1 hypothetical protein [Bacteroidales bacterium]